jgi:RNA polymerase sigma factor (sigma-70 family)
VRRLAVVSNLMEQEPSASFDLEDRIAVWAEVDRLPERQRHVLYLRYRADLPFEDIASVLAISASAARSHAAQAMGTLRRRLGVGMDR